jgi:hypothetical protein
VPNGSGERKKNPALSSKIKIRKRGRRVRKPQNRLFATSCDGYVILRGKREITASRRKIRDIAHFGGIKKALEMGFLFKMLLRMSIFLIVEIN